MYELILLGQIPGTNIQLSFLAWLYLFGILVITALLTWMFIYRHRISELNYYHRVILPANRIHQRISL